MKIAKRIEKYGKRKVRNVLKRFVKPSQLVSDDFDIDSVRKIIVIRQDSRLGNLILMTPLISGLRAAFPEARLDVLISEEWEAVYRHNPEIDRIVLFEKKKTRIRPWRYLSLLRSLKKERYDLAVDVSNGSTFSLNNVILTALTGAKFRYGYDREDAASFLNLLAPAPPKGVHMADALFGLAKYLAPDIPSFRMSCHFSDDDRAFATEWLSDREIADLDNFFVIHPGGRGKKQWGIDNFSKLIERISQVIGVKIVLIGGSDEKDFIGSIQKSAGDAVYLLQDVTVGQMSAIVENCDMFISNDTGPMHVSAALGRPTVGIFVSSDFRKYGPRGANCRTVIECDGRPTVEDVFLAIMDLMGAGAD